MKIGIMGGTFDPLHIGHLLAAESARDSFQLDEIWFIPSHIPPHKDRVGASGEQRVSMVAAAIAEHTSFRIIDLEVRRGGVSYTVDTIRELQQTYIEMEFYFIIGADMVNYLPNWDRIEELSQMITFIGVGRPGSPLDIDALPSYLQGKVLLADMPLVDISSTEIRERVMLGHSIRYMVPDRVHEYILRSGIYEI